MSSFPKELCIPIRSPLSELDTEKQTYGCRQSNPDICGYCYIEGTCAFSSKDKICKHPSAKWKKIYKELKEAENEIL
jgi:hypothetical protein